MKTKEGLPMAKRQFRQEVEETNKKPAFDQDIERRETDRKEIWSDTFKLTVGLYVKRDGLASTPDEDPNDFVEAEHVHFYRTFDSDGKKLDRSAPMCNHFHVVKTEPNPKDPTKPIILEVSGPMKLGKRRKQGRWVLEPVPLNDYDSHSHGVEYIKSGKVKARVTNIEAQKVLAYEFNKGAPVAGVVES